MTIGIDPTVDFACKRVLGSPEHPAITLHFLNAVLQFRSPIREVQILNPTLEKEFEDDKWSLLDILATDERGRLYGHRSSDDSAMGPTRAARVLRGKFAGWAAKPDDDTMNSGSRLASACWTQLNSVTKGRSTTAFSCALKAGCR